MVGSLAGNSDAGEFDDAARVKETAEESERIVRGWCTQEYESDV